MICGGSFLTWMRVALLLCVKVSGNGEGPAECQACNKLSPKLVALKGVCSGFDLQLPEHNMVPPEITECQKGVESLIRHSGDLLWLCDQSPSPMMLSKVLIPCGALYTSPRRSSETDPMRSTACHMPDQSLHSVVS